MKSTRAWTFLTRPECPTPQLPAIQGLRAAAALSVAVLHVSQASGALVGTPGEVPFGWMARVPWEAGVDVFFVVSGFVMAYSSAALFGARGAADTFARRRFARVAPLYWIVTTATVLIALAAPGALNDPLGGGPGYVFASYLFIPWARPDGFVQPVFRLGWTLNFEAFFYVVFAAVLTMRWRAAASAVSVASVIAALVVAGRIARPASPPLATWTDPIMLEFAAGVLLGFWRTSDDRPVARPLLIGIALVATAMLALNGTHDGAWRFAFYGVPALILVGCAAATPPAVRPHGPVSRAWLRLGDASYALYLVHLFPARALRMAFSRLDATGPAAAVMCIALGLLASCLAALALHRWVERPATRAARRLAGA